MDGVVVPSRPSAYCLSWSQYWRSPCLPIKPACLDKFSVLKSRQQAPWQGHLHSAFYHHLPAARKVSFALVSAFSIWRHRLSSSLYACNLQSRCHCKMVVIANSVQIPGIVRESSSLNAYSSRMAWKYVPCIKTGKHETYISIVH